jgi:hypothetical protein
VPENQPANRTRNESESKSRKGDKRSHHRIELRKKQLVEYQCGRRAVEKKVIPFDRNAYHTGKCNFATLFSKISVALEKTHFIVHWNPLSTIWFVKISSALEIVISRTGPVFALFIRQQACQNHDGFIQPSSPMLSSQILILKRNPVQQGQSHLALT